MTPPRAQRLLALLVLALVPVAALRAGPFDPRSRPLSAERPDITDSCSTVGRGVLQLESGVTIQRDGDERRMSLPDTLLRIGTSSRAELRIGVPTLVDSRVTTWRSSGVSDVGVSFKMRLSKPGVGRGITHPKLALTAQATLPTGSSAVGEPNWQPGLKLGAGYSVSGRLGVTMNLACDRASDAGVRFDRFTGSASFEYKLSSRLHPILEYLRAAPAAPGDRDAELVDIGAALWVSKDLALDMLAGINVDGTDPGHFITAGISKRW